MRIQYEADPSSELYHFGIKGMHWYQRRYQNEDGSLTTAGRARYATKNPGASDAKAKINREQKRLRAEFKRNEKNRAIYKRENILYDLTNNRKHREAADAAIARYHAGRAELDKKQRDLQEYRERVESEHGVIETRQDRKISRAATKELNKMDYTHARQVRAADEAAAKFRKADTKARQAHAALTKYGHYDSKTHTYVPDSKRGERAAKRVKNLMMDAELAEFKSKSAAAKAKSTAKDMSRREKELAAYGYQINKAAVNRGTLSPLERGVIAGTRGFVAANRIDRRMSRPGTDYRVGRQVNRAAVRREYERYKDQHPNSDMSLTEFEKRYAKKK